MVLWGGGAGMGGPPLKWQPSVQMVMLEPADIGGVFSAFSHTLRCARWRVFKLSILTSDVYFCCVYTFWALFCLKTGCPVISIQPSSST